MKDTLSIAEFEDLWQEQKGWEIERGKQDILRHENGPLWVLAGPGTGKTEGLIIRALRLLLVDGEEPASIFLTTFTEKGAEELEDRISRAVADFGYDDEVDVSNLRTGTLHSLCDEVMSEYRYPRYIDLELLDQNDQEFFIKRHSEMVDWVKSNDYVHKYFKALRLPWKTRYPPNTWEATRMAVELANRTRQYVTDPVELQKSDEQALAELGEQLVTYQDLLADDEHHRCDFAELQSHFLDFLDTNHGERFLDGDDEVDKPPLKHVLVDEYQDTNPLQEQIYFRLAEACDENIVAVGDDDQALYRFRGGTVECMVRFGDVCRDRLGQSPEVAQLVDNYRSHPDIVDWINRFITYHGDLGEGTRVADKEQLNAASGIDGKYPAVAGIFGASRPDTAKSIADFVNFLIEDGIVTDPNQIALLLRSTRESPKNAGPFVEALRDRGIDVYNPRNKALTDHEEVELALGCLLTVLDREMHVRDNTGIRGNFLKTVDDWVEAFDTFRQTPDGDELDEYVEQSHENLEAIGTSERVDSLQDIFYRILSCEPFSTWREEDPNRSKRLAMLTDLLEAFTNVYSGNLRTSSHYEGHFSHGWLRGFYYNFVQYVAESGFDEPEDPYDQRPSGYVQALTVHQAKGLEFPFVIAGDITKDDPPGGTHFLEEVLSPYSALNVEGTSKEARAASDNVRRFFVQYSRAQDALVLAGAESGVEPIALGNESNGNRVQTDWFDQNDRRLRGLPDFERYRDVDREFDEQGPPRRKYSVTGDILSFRRCARQYGHFSDLGYTPAQEAQLYFGTVIHRTLDRLHQQYRGQIDGKSAGKPTESDVREYFEQVHKSLVAHGTRPMGEEAKERARDYLVRFNDQMAEELFGKVLDTEHHLKTRRDDFVMEGTVDVLARENASNEDPSTWEIWDYKASKVPDGGSIDLENYRYQMQVYAGMYENKNGVLPERAVLYFLGEANPEEARYEIPFDRALIDDAMERFTDTVGDIEDFRAREEWPAPAEPPSKETCDACDLRWDCEAVEGAYPRRTP